MSALEKINGFNKKATFGIEWIGIIAFIFMMLLTTVDVIGTKVFLVPVPGALDLMMLAQLVAMSLVLGSSYISNRHVEVEFFVPLLPRLLRRLVALIIQLLVVVLFITLTWRMFAYAQDLKHYGEVSPTIRLALFPFAYAAALAFIPACLVALAKLLHLIGEVFKR